MSPVKGKEREIIMRKKILGLLALCFVLILSACGDSEAEGATQVKVGVVGSNNPEWEHIQNELKKSENIDLEIVQFSDYRAPIVALEDGSIDLHAALTEIYMEEINKESGFNNTAIAYTTLNPMGVFSNKLNDLSELENNAIVAIPNDVSNESRALLLLQTAGVIEVDPEAGLLPNVDDITSNPKNLEFISMEANQTARALNDADISLINNDMATDAGLIPIQDAIYLEPVAESSEPYFNVIAARENEIDNQIYQTIIDYFHTEEVADIIEEKSAGSSIPLWKQSE